MKRPVLLLVFLLTATASAPRQAIATCPAGTFNPVQHALGGWFASCADANPVSGFIYTLGSADANNSAGVDVVCEVGNVLNGQGAQCQPEGGMSGDGAVTVSFDYGNPGSFPGCPNPELLGTAPRQVIQVIANDGASLLATVGWWELQLYGVDFSQPDRFPPEPLECGWEGHGIEVLGFDGTTLRARLVPPLLHSDCDPGTWGLTGGGIINPICDFATLPSISAGRLFTRLDQCGTSPDPLLREGWTLLATPEPSGQVSVDIPRADSPDTCTFIGATAVIGGAETLAIVGSLQIPSRTEGTPGALDVQARQDGGDVVVSWRTETEVGLIGFRLIAVDPTGRHGAFRVTDTLIASQAGPVGGGAFYETGVGLGVFRGTRALVVESVMASGDPLRSEPVSF